MPHDPSPSRSVTSPFPHAEELFVPSDFALRAGFLYHGPGDGVAVIGNGLAHALHGDVRGVGHVRAEANHNEGVLEREREKKGELENRRLRPHD